MHSSLNLNIGKFDLRAIELRRFTRTLLGFPTEKKSKLEVMQKIFLFKLFSSFCFC